jgi:hypothetical protein
LSAADAISGRTSHALDLLNFLLADVRDGLGPYLSIYLLLTHHWDQASIGLLMGIGGLAAIAAQTPVGAAVQRQPGRAHHHGGVVRRCRTSSRAESWSLPATTRPSYRWEFSPLRA